MGFLVKIQSKFEKHAGKIFALVRKFAFEFVVILVSVFLAFYLDREYERFQDYQTELGLLKESKNNLMLNVSNIEKNIRDETRTIENVKRVLIALDKEKIQPESLFLDYKRIAWMESIELENSGYFALKSFGLRKIENDSLRKKLINLYEIEYPKLIERTFTTSSVYRDLMLHEIYKKFSYDFKNKNYIPNNYDSLRTDVKFKNMVSFSVELKEWRIREKTASVDSTKKVIALINEEIVSRE